MSDESLRGFGVAAGRDSDENNDRGESMNVGTLKSLLEHFHDDDEVVIDTMDGFFTLGYWGLGVRRGDSMHLLQNDSEIEDGDTRMFVLVTREMLR